MARPTPPTGPGSTSRRWILRSRRSDTTDSQESMIFDRVAQCLGEVVPKLPAAPRSKSDPRFGL